MSKIEELIQQYCPDGVEFKELGEVCKVLRGKRLTKNELSDNAKYPVFHGGLDPLGFYNESNRVANTVMVINVGASAGTVGFSAVDFWSSDGCFCISHSINVIPRFLYYALIIQENTLKSKVRKAGIPTLDSLVISKLQIPVPQLIIQQEIVRILDSFTELEAEMEAELEAELEARKKQYEFYRNKLLTPQMVDGKWVMNGEEVKWNNIESICNNITSGGTPLSTNSTYYNGSIPWLRTQEVDWVDIYDTGVKITDEGLKNSSAKWIPVNCVIVAMYGATAAKVSINKIPLTTNQACCNLNIDPKLANYRYVFHWLSKEYSALKSLGEGSQSNINAKKIRKYPIPIPTISEQERIVSILDKFDSLVNDISVGLPAEIEARRRQYEYYRNKLLTFKRIDN